MHFNPRPREGSDVDMVSVDDKEVISIHAPARGATLLEIGCRNVFLISIHAPARGATQFTYCKSNIFWISIHAPARGATLIDSYFLKTFEFQSTPPRGERLPLRQVSAYRSYFNPRPREGSDFYHLLHFPSLYMISIHAPARGATEKHFYVF